MPKTPSTQEQHLLELADLRARLGEAEEALRAIRNSEVDALMVSGMGGEQLFTLKGADYSYRMLIEDMSEGALTLTEQGVILYANRRFAEMLKTPLENVIGTTIDTWIAPTDKTISQTLLRRDDTQTRRRGEIMLLASDGTLVPAYLSINFLQLQEAQRIICMVATDLTKQKRNEAIVTSEKLARESLAVSNQSRLALLSVIEDQKRAKEALHRANDELEARVEHRTAALAQTNAEVQLQKTILESQNEASTDGILFLSETGMTRSFNRRFAEMWGIPPDLPIPFDEATNQAVRNKLQDPAAFQARVEYIEKQKDKKSRDEILLKDGRVFDRYSAPARGTDGISYGRTWFYRDITETKQAEVALHQATAEANRANHAKSEFLSRMSHELRTPLNAILGFGQILSKQDLTPLGIESIGHILKGGQHLLILINEVLDISRVEAGHVELSLEPVALGDVVPEVCALVRPLTAVHSIRLDENTSALGRCHILADHQRLKQVLINLISNAIKYNREGGQVEVFCDPNPEGWISIAIRDTGQGISPQDLLKLFTPFERLSASGSDIEGTGLGLVLSQRLLTAMGGTIGVESTLGQGSTFTIRLPQATSPVEQLANLPEGRHPLSTSMEAERTYTVLCIEDNPSNLRLLEVILEGRPEITLLTAIQGSVGLDLARQHEPDLILLDLNLPDIPGFEVLARLQQSAITREIPVVVVSADATPKQVERLLAAGAKAYLTKPLDVDQFLHTLDTFLSGDDGNRHTTPLHSGEEAV